MTFLERLGKINSNPETWAMSAHFAIGYGVVLTGFCKHALWPTFIFMFLFVCAKEFWFDLKYEVNETIYSSTIDWLLYVAGMFAALGMVAFI